MLVDTGCGHMLVKTIKGPWAAKMMQMICIHRDVREYREKKMNVWLQGVDKILQHALDKGNKAKMPP